MKSVLLVHGAWHGSWCWDLIVPRLEVLGINVATIDLPFNGFDNDVLAVSELIDSIEDDLIVLGHSYGGMVISEATQAKPNVKQLIYLSAILLKEGENVNGDEERTRPSKIRIEVDEDLNSIVKKDAIIPAFYEDVAIDIAGKYLGKLRNFPINSISTGRGEAWKEIETTYVVCGKDSAIDPERQREMAELADSILEWDCGHSPFFSNPDILCSLLFELAKNSC